jgi:hypothetical protein
MFLMMLMMLLLLLLRLMLLPLMMMMLLMLIILLTVGRPDIPIRKGHATIRKGQTKLGSAASRLLIKQTSASTSAPRRCSIALTTEHGQPRICCL